MGKRSPSNVFTGPLGMHGTESPLRGLRANTGIALDESASINQAVRDAVIAPFSRVARDPMGTSRVGKAPFFDIQAGTIRYDWQVYTRYVDEYGAASAEGDRTRIVVEFNYTDAFYRVDNKKDGELVFVYGINLRQIEDELERGLVDIDTFLMENKNVRVSQKDSEFPGTLIEKARQIPDDEVEIEAVLEYDGPCICGVDVARTSNATAFVVLALEKIRPFDSVIFAEEMIDVPYQDQADFFYEMLNRFPGIELFVMDQGGGGLAIRDLLYKRTDGSLPIYDPEDDAVDPMLVEGGHEALRMDYASNELNTLRANFAKARMQSGKLKFATPRWNTGNDRLNAVYRSIYMLGQQFTWIRSAPSGQWKKYEVTSDHQMGVIRRKDLFSGLLLALDEVRVRNVGDVEVQDRVVDMGEWVARRGGGQKTRLVGGLVNRAVI